MKMNIQIKLCAMEAQNQQDIYDGKRPTYGFNDFMKLMESEDNE